MRSRTSEKIRVSRWSDWYRTASGSDRMLMTTDACRVTRFRIKLTLRTRKVEFSIRSLPLAVLYQSLQRLTLIFSDVRDRTCQLLITPQIPFATAIGPWTAITFPAIIFTHFPCGVSLECVHHFVRRTISGDNNVNVICPNVANPERPLTNVTRFPYRFFNLSSLRVLQFHWRLN